MPSGSLIHRPLSAFPLSNSKYLGEKEQYGIPFYLLGRYEAHLFPDSNATVGSNFILYLFVLLMMPNMPKMYTEI